MNKHQELAAKRNSATIGRLERDKNALTVALADLCNWVEKCDLPEGSITMMTCKAAREILRKTA